MIKTPRALSFGRAREGAFLFGFSGSASAIKLLMFRGGQVKQFFTRGKQTAAVFKGLDRTILWTTGNSVYRLTGTISMDELKQAAEAIQ